MSKQPDWEAIERAYRAGALSIRTIADRNGVSDTAIRKKAKALGWERAFPSRSAKRFAISWFAARFAKTNVRTPSGTPRSSKRRQKRAQRLFAATAATFAKPRTLRTC